jgi:glycosyltransferase involved in cell wall biosynthesis
MHYLFRHHASGVVCVCDHSKHFLISHGVPSEKISTVHNGLELLPVPESQTSLRRELNIPDDSIVIGIASRIDPIKGLKYLLDAVEGMISEGVNLDVVLAGDGNSVEALKAQSVNLGIAARVHFVGFQKDMTPWLTLFDVFALPSLGEYHSIGLLEAMRAQKAIVASSVGGNTESVRNGKEALIVPPADSAALRSALQKMIDSSDLRHSLALAARHRYEEKFTVETTKKKLSKWLLEFDVSR